jgi:hypothetical protein
MFVFDKIIIIIKRSKKGIGPSGLDYWQIIKKVLFLDLNTLAQFHFQPHRCTRLTTKDRGRKYVSKDIHIEITLILLT